MTGGQGTGGQGTGDRGTRDDKRAGEHWRWNTQSVAHELYNCTMSSPLDNDYKVEMVDI